MPIALAHSIFASVNFHTVDQISATGLVAVPQMEKGGVEAEKTITANRTSPPLI